MIKQKEIVVAVDGTGGDRGYLPVVNAARFALALYPALKLIVFGPHDLDSALVKAGVDSKRYEFSLAPQSIPQDEDPKEVLSRYRRSAMRLAVEAVKEGRAHAVVSGGGTGPFVVLCRHILGTIGRLRPALCARMPSGPGHFTLMLDLGANASCTSQDLLDFARLGSIASKYYQGISDPRVAILNVGTEAGKGSRLIQEAKSLIQEDQNLLFEGFVEANRIFCGDCDVIVTDGFTGNVALKAAEGVASLLMKASGIKRFFAKMATPEWLTPWQYNGSILLGVNGIAIKSHASAGDEALAVAMVEAAKAVQCDLYSSIKEEIDHSYGHPSEE